MLKSEKEAITKEVVIDVTEMVELACNLPQKEKEHFFYMMKGVMLMTESLKEEKEGRSKTE